DGDDDLAARTTLSQVPDGPCNLAQHECSVDNRLERACLQELAQHLQVIFARDCDQRTQLLTHEQRQHLCPELAIDAYEPLPRPPRRRLAFAHRPSRAVRPDGRHDAVCQRQGCAGFSPPASARTRAYSENAPRHVPNTSSPRRKPVTLSPTASTIPATS